MARPRNFQSPRGNVSQRKVTWAVGPNGQTPLLSSGTNNLFPIAVQSIQDDQTIVRTRGSLLVQLVSASAGLEGFAWHFGMAIVTENAAGIGVTAVPDPLIDIAWDGWFVYETGHVVGVDATPDEASPGSVQVIKIDSKAMRKIHASDVVVALFSVTEIGAATMQAALSTRLLFKLP